MSEQPGFNPEKENLITLNLAEMRSLTPFDDEFIVDRINDGEDVIVGRTAVDGRMYLRCDFSQFDKNLAGVTPERLSEYFINDGSFEAQAPGFEEDDRRLMHACWRVTKIAKKLFSGVGSENVRNASFANYVTKSTDGNPVCAKPLSECVGQAVCAEYSILVKHILEKLGYNSSMVIGAFSEDGAVGSTGQHTFLAVGEGGYVFDPTHTAQKTECWPPSFFRCESPMAADTITSMETDPDKPLGVKIECTDVFTGKKSLYGSGA